MHPRIVLNKDVYDRWMAVANWVFAFYLGAAHTERAALSFSLRDPAAHIAFTAADFRGESLTPPLYYGYRVSYFPRHAPLGVEGEFTHLKVYANLPEDSIIQRFSMSHGLNLVAVNVVARATIHNSSRGPVQLMARGGAGPTIPHVESTIAGVSQEGYQSGAIALTAGGGVLVGVSRHLSALVEYKLSRTRETVDTSNGEARGVFLSHHALVGIAWHP